MKILRNMLGRTKALIGVFALLCLQNAYAIDAGQYYYYISENVFPKALKNRKRAPPLPQISGCLRYPLPASVITTFI